MTGSDVLNEVIMFPGVSSRPSKAQREAARTRFPPRPVVTDGLPPGTTAVRCGVAHQRDVCTRQRQQPGPTHPRAGVAAGLATDQPGQTWQQRWMASGADAAGGAWRNLPIAWQQAHGRESRWLRAELSGALVVAICGDLVRPSLAAWWPAQQRLPDPQPGPHPRPARVRASSSVVRRRSPGVRLRRRPHAAAQRRNPRRQGRHPGRRHRRRRVGIDGPRSRILHLPDTRSQGLLPDAARTRCLQRRRAATTASISHRRSAHPGGTRRPLPAALPPVRDLLVDYLRERQPALDYTSLKGLAYYLVQRFWADLEQHHPGIDSLHLPSDVADAWKQRQRTKPQVITSAHGEKSVVMVERIGYRDCLTPVRALYLDLCQWAIKIPAGGHNGGSCRSVRKGSVAHSSTTARRGWTHDPGTTTGAAGAGTDRRRRPGTPSRSCSRPRYPSRPIVHRRRRNADSLDHQDHREGVGPRPRDRQPPRPRPRGRHASGRGPPSKSSVSPVAGSKNCSRSAITA